MKYITAIKIYNCNENVLTLSQDLSLRWKFITVMKIMSLKWKFITVIKVYQWDENFSSLSNFTYKSNQNIKTLETSFEKGIWNQYNTMCDIPTYFPSANQELGSSINKFGRGLKNHNMWWFSQHKWSEKGIEGVKKMKHWGYII